MGETERRDSQMLTLMRSPQATVQLAALPIRFQSQLDQAETLTKGMTQDALWNFSDLALLLQATSVTCEIIVRS